MTDTAASGKRSIPKSSIILLCLFIVYLALTFIGAPATKYGTTRRRRGISQNTTIFPVSSTS